MKLKKLKERNESNLIISKSENIENEAVHTIEMTKGASHKAQIAGEENNKIKIELKSIKMTIKKLRKHPIQDFSSPSSNEIGRPGNFIYRLEEAGMKANDFEIL